jgi:signal transduction histidine kinase
VSWSAYPLHSARVAHFRDATQVALIVFFAYLLGAEAAFVVGTLSDKIFAPFWPPNIVLFCALLVLPRERWWLALAAAFPAHVIAEVKVGMPVHQLMVAFATNIAVALAAAEIIRRLQFPWFRTSKSAAAYVVLVGVLCPAVVALGGAFVPIAGGGAPQRYFEFWLQWTASNALGFLMLGPAVLLFARGGAKALWPAKHTQRFEFVGMLLLMAIVAHVALPTAALQFSSPFIVALLYAPVPLIVWCAVRFGAAGASAGVLTAGLVFVAHEISGPSLFTAGNPENNVLALQALLVFLSVPVLLLGAGIDEIRQLERNLSADEERLALVARAANVGFWIHDTKSRELRLSDHCTHLFSLADGPTSLDVLLKAAHPNDARTVEAVVTGQRPSGEFRIVLPQGGERWILARSDLEGGDRTKSEVNGLFIEITSRKAVEAELEKQGRELTHLMRVSQLGELSGGLAHELTQPLTAILANAQAARIMLTSDPSNVTVLISVLDDIIREDQRAGEVIKRLRSLIRKEDGAVEEVDVGDLCKSVLTLLHAEAIGRRMTTKFVAGSNVPHIVGDQIQLQQVILNLVMNAMEAEQRNESSKHVVLLQSRRIGDSIEIAVQDDGVGISPLHSGKLFEPFFTTKERGLGLGLSICSAIVRRHGGTLALENNVTGGATAYLRLPVYWKGVAS